MLLGLSKQRRDTPLGLGELLVECHGRIRSFTSLALELGRTSGSSAPDVADACARVERYFREALPLHVADEEESILPRLRGLEPALDAALEAMQTEHAQHDTLVEALLSATESLRAAPSDEHARLQLGVAAAELEGTLLPHLAREEAVIFVAVQRLLRDSEHAEIVRELRRRRTRDT